MEQLGGGQSVVERPMGGPVVEAEVGGEGAELAVGHLVAESRRASGTVSTRRWSSARPPVDARAASRNEVSKRMLWPTSTAPPTNSARLGSTCGIVGAGASIAWVMPVSAVISGGTARPG